MDVLSSKDQNTPHTDIFWLTKMKSLILSAAFVALYIACSPSVAQWQWEVLDLGFAETQADAGQYRAALSQGEQVFGTYCMVCHGVEGAGMPGVPNLLDDETLWGPELADMAYVIKYGIRSGHEKARFYQMPAYGEQESGVGYDAQLLIDLTYYVGSLRGEDVPADAVTRAEDTAINVCSECHGFDFAGQVEWYGAPSLIDDISLYGHDYATVYDAIERGREGESPVWENILSDQQIRDVTLYIGSIRE